MANFISGIISKAMATGERSENILPEPERIELKEINCENFRISETPNIVADKYEINTEGEKIAALSSEQADAYEAKEISTGSTDYYCLVFKKNCPIRFKEIVALQAAQIANLITPLEVGITPLKDTAEKFLCAICRKPQGKSLKELITEHKQFSKHFILKKVVAPLNEICASLHEIGIVHGYINPSSVYIDENEVLTLSECISSICGLKQPAFYETIERAQSHRYGKGSGEPSIDYYALGMTAFNMIAGIFINNSDEKSIIKDKLQEGSFNFLMQNFHLNGTLGDLIRGLVIDNAALRWRFPDVENIITDHSYTVNNLVDKSLLNRPIIFQERQHYSKITLAHDLSIHWEEAKAFVKQDALIKWLDISIHEHDTINALDKLKDLIDRRLGVQALFSKEDEWLMKVIIILDPMGPIRYKGLAFHKDGLGSLLSYSLISNNNEIMQFIANALFINLFSFFESLAVWFKDRKYARGLLELKMASENIRRGGYGFGIERCLYDLNPSLPCQSHIMKNELCYGLKDVLLYIEQNEITIDELLYKKNLLCFIASKSALSEDIRMPELRHYQLMEKNKEFISLVMLSTAQQKANIPKLSKLCELYAERLKTVLYDSVKGETIKKNIFAAIDSVKSSGDLALLKRNAAHVQYLAQDVEGFTNATKRVNRINYELLRLKNRYALENEAREKGLKIAVNAGYIVTAISIIFAIIKGF